MKMILRFPSFFVFTCHPIRDVLCCVMLGCVCVVGKFLNRINIIPIWEWAKYDRMEKQKLTDTHALTEKSQNINEWEKLFEWKNIWNIIWFRNESQTTKKECIFAWSFFCIYLECIQIQHTGPRKKNWKYINKKSWFIICILTSPIRIQTNPNSHIFYLWLEIYVLLTFYDYFCISTLYTNYIYTCVLR